MHADVASRTGRPPTPAVDTALRAGGLAPAFLTSDRVVTPEPLPPVTLQAEHTRLEHLSLSHREGLAAVAFDPELWRFTPTQIDGPEHLDAYLRTALSLYVDGTSLPFAIVERASGRAIGSTRLAHVDLVHGRAELGWTWLGRSFQRRAFNTESKLLILGHTFEQLGLHRVELRADSLNTRSRNAILRLGAREEGTLRQHTLLPEGRRVDWVHYSILADEWPAVRAGLDAKLADHRSAR